MYRRLAVAGMGAVVIVAVSPTMSVREDSEELRALGAALLDTETRTEA